MRHTITKIYITFALMLVATFGFSQGIVTGIAWDGDLNETMVGASVVVKGTANGVTTDFNGKFRFMVGEGQKTIVFSFIGYSDVVVPVTMTKDGFVDLGKIVMNADAVGLQEIQLIANVAVDRKTPVAVTTISPITIEEKLGAQEFPEILKSTPGVYVTKQGGGFGDSRINVRGFDMKNTAVLVNGIPVNDMENGWVYWSNWAGLSDVTRSMQVQRGLGASKLSIGSVGGTINIITKTTDAKKGGSAYVGVGNDGRQKESVTLSTGLTESGVAVTFSGSHTKGRGWADATQFEGWSYFLNISKSWENQTLSFTVFGAPQVHGQRRSKQTIETINDPANGLKYNSDWGYKNGEKLNLNENFYHKPQITLNHYLTISENTQLSTSAYVSIGKGGGTGEYGDEKSKFFTYKREGQIDYDKIVDENIANGNAGSTAIMRSSNNNHQWFGLLSNLQHNINENLELSGGIDARYYKGEHYREVTDLMGGGFILDDSDKSNPGFHAKEGDIIGYHNDGEVSWLGLFAQAEYSVGELSTFLSAAVNTQGLRRTDYFSYTEGPQTSDWVNHTGFVFKGGANYNLTENHNVFFNTGYFERAPFFDAVFINYKNDVNEGALNEKTFSIEAGYGFRAEKFSANINAYYTMWMDKYLRRSIQAPDGEIYQANLTGVNATHMGIEGDFLWKPIKRFEINGSFSLGNWFWANDIKDVQIYDDNQAPIGSPINIYMKDLKVGDAAQTTFALGASYDFFDALKLGVSYHYFDNLYAQFDPTGRQDEAEAGVNSWEVPSYNLLDLNVRYSFTIAGLDATAYSNVNNLLNTKYISDADDGATHNWDTSRVFYGVGTTWSAGIRVRF